VIPPAKPGGIRELMNGVMYVLWPKDLPPKSTVHDYPGCGQVRLFCAT
jgi:hypothetical protein